MTGSPLGSILIGAGGVDTLTGAVGGKIGNLLIGGQGGVHHVWGCDHFKTTLNATEFKRVYKRRTDLVKTAMDSVPAGDRAAQANAVMDAIGVRDPHLARVFGRAVRLCER